MSLPTFSPGANGLANRDVRVDLLHFMHRRGDGHPDIHHRANGAKDDARGQNSREIPAVRTFRPPECYAEFQKSEFLRKTGQDHGLLTDKGKNPDSSQAPERSQDTGDYLEAESGNGDKGNYGEECGDAQSDGYRIKTAHHQRNKDVKHAQAGEKQRQDSSYPFHTRDEDNQSPQQPG